jgi:Ca2+-binding RTX toxin-like protein
VAVYSITAPGPTGSTFNAVDDGTYTIALEAGQVSDTFASPNYVVGGALGQFTVDISPTTGTVNALSPTASLTAIPSVTTPLSNVSFLVTYTDTTGLLFSTLGDGNIVVDGPNLYSEPATLVSAAPAANSTAIVAEYSVPAPPGESTFTTSDNGSYIVIMQGDQVSDTEAVPEVVPLGVLGQFQVNIAAGTVGSAAGTSPLTAIFQPLATLTSTVNSIPFTVTYSDSTPINIASISSNNILVDGPGSFSQFATFVSASPAQDADTIVATYHIVPPAPIPPATGPTYFGTSNNGTYVIILEPGQVSDTATPANFASVGLLGQFVVNVALANNVAPIPPTATLSAVSPVTVPVTAISVTVVYTDSASIIESSLSQNNAAILVTGPNGYTRNATVSGIQAATNGWSVTYSVTAPIEYFNPTDNGTYTISLANNEVFDQASQTFAAATLGTFSVNIAGVSLGANGILTVNGTDQADSIEFTLVGSNIRVLYNNSATGYPTGNVTGIVCNGLGGNDTITVDPGLAGANSILVNSTLMGGPGDDTINGGSGADSIGGGQGNNVLFGGPGNDTIVAGNGNSLLRGGEGDDLLRGGQGNDTMRGGQGNDTFFAGHGDNVIYGGAGDDVIYANNGFADTIVGGAGNNTATIDYNLDLLYNIQTIL